MKSTSGAVVISILKNTFLGIFFCLIFFGSYFAYAAPPTLAFAQSPLFSMANVSPSGKYFFAVVTRQDIATFTVFDLDNGGEIVASMQETQRGFVQRAWWANDDTIILSIGFLGGRRVRLHIEGEAEQYYTQSATGLFVLPVSSEQNEVTDDIWLLSRGGSLVSLLRNDPDHILIQETTVSNATIRTRRNPSVYKRSIRKKGISQRIQRNVADIFDWQADRTGRVRVGYGGARVSSGKIEYKLLMRTHSEDDFRDVSDRYYARDPDQRFIPLSFAENIDQIYVASNHATDTLALYLFDIGTEEYVSQLYHNPNFDVDSVFVDGLTGELLSVTYGEDGRKTVWFDEILNSEIDAIGRNFPGREVVLASFSRTANAGIVQVSSATFPGQLFLFDRARGELSPLPLQYPGLPESELGNVFSTFYVSRDGKEIPAFITTPPDVKSLEQARELPFIIYPHGGPAARDFLSFDMLAHLFASRGYGVMQMNFRGSAGYGLEYEKAGRREWGRLMQDDVSDGVNWLVNENFADPDRVAIYGGSYGGYVALMGAVLTPELYQCAVSFAGVTNLPDLVAGQYKNSYITRMVGDRFDQGDELRRFSPLFRAKDFEIPVLLIHGRLDYVVPYEHSEEMYRLLRKEKKDAEFVLLPQSVHGLNDYDDRVRFYGLVDNYFDNCLSGEP